LAILALNKKRDPPWAVLITLRRDFFGGLLESKTLVQIINDHMALGSLLDEIDGELSQTTEDWLAENSQSLANKIDGYKQAIDKFEFIADYMAQKAEPFAKASTVLKNKAKGLKERLKFASQVLGKKDFEGNEWICSISERKEQRLVIENDNHLPDSFKREVIAVEIDRSKVEAALLSGETVAGAHLEKVRVLNWKLNAIKIESKKEK
jgi:hypothetical protein